MSELAAWHKVYAHDRDGAPIDGFTEADRALLVEAVEGGLPVRVRTSGPVFAPSHTVYATVWASVLDGHVWAQHPAVIEVVPDFEFPADRPPLEIWEVFSTTGRRNTIGYERETQKWRPPNEGEIEVGLEWFVPAPFPGDDDPCNGVVGRFCKAGYVNVTKPSAVDPTPGGRNQWNSQGARNTVERTAVGEYTITFPRIGDTRAHGHPQATGGASATCHVKSWGGQPDAVVKVVCRDRDGNPVNSKFTLLYLN